jgi:hypothetical protein
MATNESQMDPPRIKLRYRTYKTGFKNAVRNDKPKKIQRLTERMVQLHKLRTLAHQFAKYCQLRSYEEKVQAPSIFNRNKDDGWTAYYSAIAQPESRLINPIKDWYADFAKDLNIDKTEFKNMSDQYNSHTAGQSVSLCKRHVSQEYQKHVFHFVRVHFRDEIMKRESKDERKILWSCVDAISNALVNASASEDVLQELQTMSMKYNVLFQKFLVDHLETQTFKAFVNAEQRNDMISQLCDDDDDDDISVKITIEEYEAWHKCMWYMNNQIETLNLTRPADKQVRVRCWIPLVNGIYPKHAHLYVKPLIHLLGENYATWKNTVTGVHGVWETVIKKKILDGPKSFAVRKSDGSKEKYVFARQIATDGYSGLSLLFVHPHDYDAHVQRTIRMGKASQEMQAMSLEQQAEVKKQKKAIQKQKAKANAIRQKANKKAYEEEKKKAKLNGYSLPRAGIPYFNSLDPAVVVSKHHIYIDSGHYGHDMISEHFESTGTKTNRKQLKMVAEQRHRLHVIGTKRKHQLQRTRERECRLDAAQCDERQRLNAESRYANKSTRFLEYCKALNMYASVVSRNDPQYNSWHSYQGLRTYGLKKRYESNLMTSIAEKFGDPKDNLVIIGDYSATHRPAMKGTIPAFVVGFGRLLKRSGYDVAWIDEYNTSKLYNKTNQEGEPATVEVHRPVGINDKDKNMYRRRWMNGKTRKRLDITELAVDKTVSRELHAIKLFKTGSGMKAYCNRDTNAVLNFKNIVRHWLKYGKRPSEFCRGNVTTVPFPEPIIANA